MYYEHRARQPERALKLAREALAALHSAARIGLVTPEKNGRLRARIERRIARLQAKTAAALALVENCAHGNEMRIENRSGRIQ